MKKLNLIGKTVIVGYVLLIAPFSFVCSLFMDDVAMYAVNNNGGWYDFGFVLGAGILFGGGGKASR